MQSSLSRLADTLDLVIVEMRVGIGIGPDKCAAAAARASGAAGRAAAVCVEHRDRLRDTDFGNLLAKSLFVLVQVRKLMEHVAGLPANALAKGDHYFTAALDDHGDELEGLANMVRAVEALGGDGLTNGEWSRPMSKTDMRVRLGNMTKRKFSSFTKDHPTRPVGGNRQVFQIRVDRMDAPTRAKLDRC